MSLPPVIVTRTLPGAHDTASRLKELGLEPILSPALSLELVSPQPDIPLEGAAGILFTSANAVRFFAEVSDLRELPAWCVGQSTFEEAQEKGFSSVENANGNSHDLAQLVIAYADPKAGHLVHIANTAAGDILRSELSEAGFDVRFVGLYQPHNQQLFSPDAAKAVTETGACVLIHSEKGAASFAAAVQEIETKDLLFVCISEKAAGPIRSLGEVRIAPRPNENELLRVVADWRKALLSP